MKFAELIRRCILVIAGLVCVFTIPAHAAGEHARRAASELQVLRGDIRKLATENPSSLHEKGLMDRIAGGLAGLEILLRLADQEKGKVPVDYSARMKAIRQAWIKADLTMLASEVENLLATHPLNGNWAFRENGNKSENSAIKALHDEYCAACHDEPDLDVSRPAFNLFDDARRLPAIEFAARMIVGVRGDRVTGIDNPLSDAQILGLMRYYRYESPQE